MQTSCGLSLTTSHSAHNTADCSATAFRGRTTGRLRNFECFMTGPWEEVILRSILPEIASNENGPSGSSLFTYQARRIFLNISEYCGSFRSDLSNGSILRFRMPLSCCL